MNGLAAFPFLTNIFSGIETEAKSFRENTVFHWEKTVDFISDNGSESGYDPKKEGEYEFIDKIGFWGTGIKHQLKRLVLIIYLPICLFLICRKGYNIGGTDMFNYPYREPGFNDKSAVSRIDNIYNSQTGGSYSNVLGPFTILKKHPTNAGENLMYWFVDSGATTFALGCQISSMIISMLRPICGFVPGGEPQEQRNSLLFIAAIVVGVFIIPILLLLAAFLTFFLNAIIPIIKIKDNIWPFVGTRLFSPIVWFVVLLITGLFTPYSSFLMILIIACTFVWGTIQLIALYFFVLAAPFLFIKKSYENKNTDQFGQVMRSIINGIFWLFLILATALPTKEVFGDVAMTGSFATIAFLAYSSNFNVFN